jgi:SAM-dependent methyltransferase
MQPWVTNGTLKSRAEWERAAAEGRRLRVPLHRGAEKNWDHLAAVFAIRKATTTVARVLDAGAEMYSNVLPALYRYGYRELYGMNLSFPYEARRGPIRYMPGDITRTGFADGFFDAVACLSVIEHGVPLEGYFLEMLRVLRPGGVLITSTDYFPEPVETGGQRAHGAPIKIFSRAEMEAMLRLAESVGFERTGAVDLDCDERPVRWEQFGLEYSFVLFTLRKPVAQSS